MTSVKDSEETATVGYWKSHLLHYFGEKKENKETKRNTKQKNPLLSEKRPTSTFCFGKTGCKLRISKIMYGFIFLFSEAHAESF